MTVSAEVDERTLRELYLAGIRADRAARAAADRHVRVQPLNGIPAAEHHWLLTDVLRDEWGSRVP